MHHLIRLKTITSPLLMTLTLLWFALSPPLKAVDCPSACGSGGNTAVGINALDSVTTGINNAAVGTGALTADTTGSFNVAVGSGALQSNTTGFQNMAIGAEALANNIDGNFNMASGASALVVNTHGERNTATGNSAMFSNTTGDRNTASGNAALGFNVAGDGNTAIGAAALFESHGDDNTAVGADALFGSGGLTGSGNTAVGRHAGGNFSGTDHDNICIGSGVAGHAGESGFIRIANNNLPEPPIVMANFSKVLIGDIHDTAITNLTNRTVQVNAAGQLAGIVVSSARYKRDVGPMDKASESILALRPVTFHYKEDKTNKLCFGLIAEEVAKVDPALVELDKEGKPLGVRYDDIPIRLLNEFLKEHKKVEEQQASITAQQATIAEQHASIGELKSTVAQQQKGMEVLTAQLKEQATQLQKVSAQLAAASPSWGGLEANRPAPQVVKNP